MKRLIPSLSHRGLLVLVGALAAGCGSNSVAPPPPPPPPPVVVHDTPQSTMTALQDTYAAQDAVGFASLLAGDFRYHFSVDTDPALVVQYGDNWDRANEVASASHLFAGFTSSGTGTYMPGAANIALALNSVTVFDDPAHADSTDYYKWVTVARVLMVVEMPGTPDPQTYTIDARHEFHLVRGDAAVLAAGQSAASNLWYIRSWDDLSVSFTAIRARTTGDPPTPAQTNTWGHLKSLYLY